MIVLNDLFMMEPTCTSFLFDSQICLFCCSKFRELFCLVGIFITTILNFFCWQFAFYSDANTVHLLSLRTTYVYAFCPEVTDTMHIFF